LTILSIIQRSRFYQAAKRLLSRRHVGAATATPQPVFNIRLLKIPAPAPQ